MGLVLKKFFFILFLTVFLVRFLGSAFADSSPSGFTMLSKKSYDILNSKMKKSCENFYSCIDKKLGYSNINNYIGTYYSLVSEEVAVSNLGAVMRDASGQASVFGEDDKFTFIDSALVQASFPEFFKYTLEKSESSYTFLVKGYERQGFTNNGSLSKKIITPSKRYIIKINKSGSFELNYTSTFNVKSILVRCDGGGYKSFPVGKVTCVNNYNKNPEGGSSKDTSLPSEVIELKAVSGSGEITLIWGEPSNKGGGEVIYNVFCIAQSEKGVTGTLFNLRERSGVVKGLTSGVEYVCSVSASNSLGRSPEVTSDLIKVK